MRPVLRLMLPALLVAGTAVALAAASDGEPVSSDYFVYVASESEDAVFLVKFGPDGGDVVRRIPVGVYPTEIEGPHGVRVSPDGRHWYVSIAHGNPYGSVFKYSTEDNVSIGDTLAGLFPATMDISSTTGLLFVVNFDLHGDMRPSTVSVIDSASMTEIGAIEQGIMPHGSSIGPDGRFHYSVGMMSDDLFEIDVMRLKVSRRLDLAAALLPGRRRHSSDANAEHEPRMAAVKPTWAEHHPTERTLYVALQGADEVVEIDLDGWRISRRFSTQKGPYNLAITPDGKRLLVTCKPSHSTAVWDLERGEELASVPASRRITHGVVASPDSRFAFVSVEGVGGEPGTVDVIDLRSFATRASIDVGKQASGIDFWKMVPR